MTLTKGSGERPTTPRPEFPRPELPVGSITFGPERSIFGRPEFRRDSAGQIVPEGADVERLARFLEKCIGEESDGWEADAWRECARAMVRDLGELEDILRELRG